MAACRRCARSLLSSVRALWSEWHVCHVRDVLQAREKGRRLEVIPPVACARRVEEATSDGDDDTRGWYDDIGDDIERGVGAAA